MSNKSNIKNVEGDSPKMNTAQIIMPVLILTAICATATLMLSLINMLTKDKISRNADIIAAQSRMEVLSADHYEQLDEDGKVYEALDSSGNQIGVVVVTEAEGYGGTIEVMTGIRSSGRVCAVKILSMSETSNLGAKIKEHDFLDQFIGSNDPYLAVDKDGGSIDAISGATVSSRAVTEAVNGAIAISVAYLDSTYAQ